jgi:hypothetical protein
LNNQQNETRSYKGVTQSVVFKLEKSFPLKQEVMIVLGVVYA